MRWRVVGVIALVLLTVDIAEAAGFSLRFFGNGSNGIDRVKIRVDEPGDTNPGPPADIGASDFTLEFWMKAAATENPAPPIVCGENADWVRGHAVIDRDRLNQDRKFGVSIAGGRVVFGVSGDGTGHRTICGIFDALDYTWHHVAVQRRRSDGWMWLYVDGILEAEADGPDGDISYPDAGVPGDFCGGPCVNSDPFLVLGAAKHDAGASFPAYAGWLDELHLSRTLRYTGATFTRPTAPLTPDLDTVALYHFDEGAGDVIGDSSGAAGGPSQGTRHHGGAPAGPAWSTDTAPLAGATIALEPLSGAFPAAVGIAHAGDGSGRLFITLRGGRIVIYDGGSVRAEPFLDIGSLVSCCVGERGMYSAAFHPDFAANGYVYVSYVEVATEALVVARYSVSALDRHRADPASRLVVLSIPQDPANAIHYGGLLKFGPDGYLYLSRGDGGPADDTGNHGQNLGLLLGKMIRIDVNGALPYVVPPDNPFVAMPGAQPEIWAYGLRNPFKFSFDRKTGDLFIADVGQFSREEVNLQPAASPGGENYGWNVLEGSLCHVPAQGCDPSGLILPVIEYEHGIPPCTSIIGGYRYRGAEIPELVGSYIYGDYCLGTIWAAAEGGDGRWSSALPADTTFFISSFGEDEAGELYVAAIFESAVYRIIHASANPKPVVSDLTPDAGRAGSPGFNLVVDGDGFARPSIVRWNGKDRPTTFVSSSRLIAAIPGTDVPQVALATVSVFTPGPGGGLAPGHPFAIDEGLNDFAPDFWAASFIDALLRAGITAGCGGTAYCPDDLVTRAQAAIFLQRGVDGPGVPPPPATGTVFADVPAASFAAAWIERLSALGLTAGCGDGRYCPESPVTRGQVAVFLLRARHGSTYEPPAARGVVFDDVPDDHPFAAWIEQLAAEGLTAGCQARLYCPDSDVSRAQMAVFLVRAFGLPL